jgi:hypothetical protein
MYVEKSTKKGKDIPRCMIYSPSEEPPDFYVPILGCVFPYSHNYSPSLVSPPDDEQLKSKQKYASTRRILVTLACVASRSEEPPGTSAAPERGEMKKQ